MTEGEATQNESGQHEREKVDAGEGAKIEKSVENLEKANHSAEKEKERAGDEGEGEEEEEESETPICFIENMEGEFCVTQEAKKMLNKIKGKIVVVCVAGPYRTGKSFLLNKLICRGERQNISDNNNNNKYLSTSTTTTNTERGRERGEKEREKERAREEGFQVGGSIRACTKGIWVWKRPVKREGKTYIFLDTEGLGSTEQNFLYDTKIFALSLLLSSFFILNTQGTINEHTLSELELVIECAKKVKMYEENNSKSSSSSKENEKGDEEEDNGENEKENNKNSSSDSNGKKREMYENIFPSFLWVLRDFMLKLTDEHNRPISSSQYLETCLQQPPVTKNNSSSTKKNNNNKNRTRETIKKVFLHRSCYTLVRPVLDEEILQNLQTIHTHDLRPEFLKQLDYLISMIFSSAPTKQINGGQVNGAALVCLAEAYTKTMNEGNMPVIHTAWEGVVLTQAAQGIESAMSVFVSGLDVCCPPGVAVEQQVLEDGFLKAEKEAICTLFDICVGNEENNKETEMELMKKINEIKNIRVTQNEDLSTLLCTQVLSEVWSNEKELKENDFIHTLLATKEQYDQKVCGPNKEKIWRNFFEEKLLFFCNRLIERISFMTIQHEELQAKKDEVSELHAEAVKIAEEQSVISERLEEELEELRQTHTTLLQTSQASQLLLQKQLSDLAEEKESLQSQLEQTKSILEETEKVKQHCFTKQQKAKERINSLTTDLQKERENCSLVTHKHQDLLVEQQNYKQQLETMEASRRAITAEQTLVSAAHSRERLQLSTSLEAQVTLARQQHEQITKLQDQVSRLENENTQREEAATAESALRLQQLQMQHSQRRFIDSDTFASLFFCLLVVVLSSRFGFGPSWLA